MSGDGPDAPALLVVQPDERRRRTLLADLSRRYGADAVLAVAAADAALRLLEERPGIGLVLTDLRLPAGTGSDLLADVRRRAPDVGRVLMTASYVDRPEHHDESDLLADALSSGVAQAAVSRPWQPAEDRLFPVLDDLLADWRLREEGRVHTLTLVCDPASARAVELRDLLTRNGLPYEWHEASSERGASLLRRAAVADAPGPVVFLHNGAVLVDPTNREVADALGVRTRPTRDRYDLVIVGAGPAGLAAAVYAASEGLATLGIEAQAFGGQAGTSSRIENYLGFPAGISGTSLMHRAGQQAGRLGAQALIPQRAVALQPDGAGFAVVLEDEQVVRGRTVVLATGVEYRRLPAEGIDRLVGSGVYYGSPTVELPGVAGGHVFLVGGGNSAGQAAVRLAQSAASVTLVVRGPSLAATMSHYLIEQLDRLPNVAVRTGTEVVAGNGTRRLQELVLRNSAGQSATRADALFVLIGAVPHTEWLPAEIARDASGYVLTGPDLQRAAATPMDWPYQRSPFLLETSLPHVFAVGDVRFGSMKRVASAVGEGSTVVSFVHEALRERAEKGAATS